MSANTHSPPRNERLAANLPILEWLSRCERAWLRPDLLAAATVWAVVVPQAIAHAQIAGLPPCRSLNKNNG